MAKRLAKKILLVGWGSADWKVINPLLEAGKLPTIAKLLEEGTKASLGVLDPPPLPISWVSLVTGQIPVAHGVKSFTELRGEEVLPVTSSYRKTKAVWNVLSDHNLKVHQVGAWGSYPAENINGVSVSDWFVQTSAENLPDDAIYPLEQKGDFAALLESPDAVSDEELNAFLVGEKVDSEEYSRLCNSIKTFIAQTNTVKASALKILETEEVDQISVFFNRLSHLTFEFMAFHINHHDSVPKNLKAVFKNVLTVAYEKLDNCLGELIEKAGSETTILLVSQGGYLPDSKWIKKLNQPKSFWEYNAAGVFIFKGRQANPKEEFFGTGLLDIVPTIYGLLGVPIAKDLHGKLLLPKQLFKEEDFIETYGVPNKEEQKEAVIDKPLAATILKQQLAGINYEWSSIEELEDIHEYFRFRIEASTVHIDELLPILEKLWKKYPENSWYGGRLAGCYLNINRPEEGKTLLNQILERGEKKVELHLLRGKTLLAERKYRSADKDFSIVAKNVGQISGIYSQLAEGYLSMYQTKEAIKYFNAELKYNSHPAIYSALAAIYMQNKQYKLALEPLRKTIEIVPKHSIAYFHLGHALFTLGEYQESADMLEKAKKLTRDPQTIKQIQNMLIQMYRTHLNKPEKLKEMRDNYEKSIGSRGTITIVSGLPRSGTSMMMQMLVKGGLTAFTDGKREADENNKKGYYEHDAVKNLAKSKKFLTQVDDQVVKIISHLLKHLPHYYKYKIVFMDREIEEVMNSQHKMLGRLGKERGEDKEKSMKLMKPFKESREKAIKWCQSKDKYVDLLLVPYTEAINNPLEQAKRVNEFLGGTLDEMAMAAVVDKSLYREKSTDISEVS